MNCKKSALATVVALSMGTVGAVGTASAGDLVLTFTNNSGATTPTGTLVQFAAGSEFHVATPYGTSLNDGHKDIISGGETWTFAGTSSSNLVNALLTGVTGTTNSNTGTTGTSGAAFLTSGVTGFPVSPTPNSAQTLAQGADFLGAGNFTILAPTTGSATGMTFGPAEITSWNTGAGTFSVNFPVLYVQWANGTYIIGGDGDGNATHNTLPCSANGPCPGPGVTLNGTLDGSGNFLLSGNYTMTKDEVTVGGFNKNIVEFSLGGTYAVNTHVVPVPAAAWLFGSGLLGMAGVARRRRNK